MESKDGRWFFSNASGRRLWHVRRFRHGDRPSQRGSVRPPALDHGDLWDNLLCLEDDWRLVVLARKAGAKMRGACASSRPFLFYSYAEIFCPAKVDPPQN
jgi:hypothetical protein